MPKQTFLNLPAEKRQVIITAAIEEFAERPYETASISRIVERAGIAKGSFYQYFEDKRDLFLHLIDIAAQEKMAFLKSKPPPDLSMGFFAYLRWLFQVGFEFELSQSQLSQVIFRALYQENMLKDASFRQYKDSAAAFYRQMIDMGIANGDVRPDIDRNVAVFLLNSVFSELATLIASELNISAQQLVTRDITEANQEEIQALVERLISILQQGLGNPTVSEQSSLKNFQAK